MGHPFVVQRTSWLTASAETTSADREIHRASAGVMAGRELAGQVGVELRVIRVGSNVRRGRTVRQGIRAVARPCWLKIGNHTTLGLATAEDTGALMVKKIRPHDWPDGEVDLLGHLF
jgi:hypothetical protein